MSANIAHFWYQIFDLSDEFGKIVFIAGHVKTRICVNADHGQAIRLYRLLKDNSTVLIYGCVFDKCDLFGSHPLPHEENVVNRC